jgi:hypothetical protein
MTRFVFLAGTIMSGLMLTTAASAQQPTQQQTPQQQQEQSGQQLSNREVRQFMQRIERDVTQIMQSGNLDRLRQWTQATIADGAVFTGTREFNADGQRKVFVNATLTKQDIMRLARLAMGTMSEFTEPQQDFNFNIQVLNVQPIGDSAALVKTRVTESQSIGGPRTTGTARFGQDRQDRQDQFTQGAGERDADDQVSRRQRGQQFGQRGQQQGAQLETQAMCTHLLKRSDDGGRIQVAMQTCDAETQLR